MNLREKAYIFLEFFENLTYKKKRDVLSLFAFPENIFTEFRTKEKAVLKLVKQDLFDEMLEKLSEAQIDKIVTRILAWKYYKGLMYEDSK